MELFGLKFNVEKVKAKAPGTNFDRFGSLDSNQLNRAMYQFLMSGSVSYYPSNNETFINQGYCMNPHAYTVISYIAQNLAQIRPTLNKIIDKKEHSKFLRSKANNDLGQANWHKSKSLEIIENHPLASPLEMPNEGQSWYEFFYEKIGYRKLTGNSYVYGLTPEGYPEGFYTRLYNAPAQLMEVISGTWQNPVGGYKLRTSFNSLLNFDSGVILHQKEWNPKLEMHTKTPYGLSPMEALLKSLQADNEGKDAELSYLIHGAPRGILSNDSDNQMNASEREASQKVFDERWGKGKDKGEIMLAATKLSWLQIGLPLVDLNILESSNAKLRDFCRVYSIPDILFSSTTGSTYNNVKEAKTQVWQDNFLIELENEKQALNRWLVPAWSAKYGVNYCIEFDTSAIAALQSDYDKLSARLLREQAQGIWTANQVIVMLGGEPDESNPLLNMRIINKGFTLFDTENFPDIGGSNVAKTTQENGL